MSSLSDEKMPLMSRFVYHESEIKSDGHVDRKVFIGPAKTRDVSVCCHESANDVNWWSGAAVKPHEQVLGSVEIPIADIAEKFKPLFVRPVFAPRMPMHADIAGWNNVPGWGLNKELARDIARAYVFSPIPTGADSYVPPLISFVLYCRNAESKMKDTIRSLQSLSFDDWECVCVDDGSTDGTWLTANRLAQEDRRIVAIRQDSSGEAPAMRRGLAEKDGARGTGVVFLTAGETMAEDVMKHILQNRDSLASGSTLCLDVSSGSRLRSFCYNRGNLLSSYVSSVCPINSIIKGAVPVSGSFQLEVGEGQVE